MMENAASMSEPLLLLFFLLLNLRQLGLLLPLHDDRLFHALVECFTEAGPAPENNYYSLGGEDGGAHDLYVFHGYPFVDHHGDAATCFNVRFTHRLQSVYIV